MPPEQLQNLLIGLIFGGILLGKIVSSSSHHSAQARTESANPGVSQDEAAAIAILERAASQASQYTGRKVRCGACNGSGASAFPSACNQCGGAGTILTPSGYTTTCPNCRGTGKAADRCPVCKGTGYVLQ